MIMKGGGGALSQVQKWSEYRNAVQGHSPVDSVLIAYCNASLGIDVRAT
jgi:hypothetical protein